MDGITYSGLRLQGPLTFSSLTGIFGKLLGNEHGVLVLNGYLCEDTAQQELMRDMSGVAVGLFFGPDDDTVAQSPLFCGTIEHISVRRDGYLFFAELTITTATSKLDKEIKSRSFQNATMTYGELVREVLADTPGAWASFGAFEDVPIERPQIQYMETDWAFLRRLASQCGLPLIPDCRTEKPGFSFGPVMQGKPFVFEGSDYKTGISGRFYELGGEEAGLQKSAFLFHVIESYRPLFIGCPVEFKNRQTVVCSVEIHIKHGLITFTYELGRPTLLCEKVEYNPKLPGLSLEGSVLKREGELITVSLDIDSGRNPGAYPFPWSPASGNLMYCMPEAGTRITLYFPGYEASGALAITSPRTSSNACQNPQNREFTTVHGKRLHLYPGSMGLRAGEKGSPLQVLLDDVNCLRMESSSRTEIAAASTISLTAPYVTLSTPRELQVLQNGNKGLTLQNQFDALSGNSTLRAWNTHSYPPFQDAPTSCSRHVLISKAIGSRVLFGKAKTLKSHKLIKRAAGSEPAGGRMHPSYGPFGLGWLLGALAAAGTALVGAGLGAGKALAGVASWAVGGLVNGVKLVGKGLAGSGKTLYRYIKRAAKNLIQSGTNMFNGTVANLSNYLDAHANLLQGLMRGVIRDPLNPENYFAYADGVGDALGDYYGSLFDDYDDAMRRIFSGGGSGGDGGLSAIYSNTELPEIGSELHPHVPEWHSGDHASGSLIINGEEIPLQSGKGPGAYLETLPRGPGSGINGQIPAHIEGHVAAIMRQTGATEAELFINKIPCAKGAMCRFNLNKILPPGSKLIVHFINEDDGKIYTWLFKAGVPGWTDIT